MKKMMRVFFMVLLLSCIFAGSAYAADIEINSAEDLNNIRNNLSGSYILMADIDLSETVWGYVYADDPPSAQGWNPIGTSSQPFTGSINGNGYSISNLYINRPNTNYVGLFGYTSGAAVISNLELVDAIVGGKSFTGVLAGNNYGNITNSSVSGNILGTAVVGGLVGENNGIITNSCATGTVTGLSESVGGLVGRNYERISTSYAAVNVVSSSYYIGGLVGYNQTGSYKESIYNSYATGTVEGGSWAGGLVGLNYSGTINNTYAIGRVTSTNTFGGLVGKNNVTSGNIGTVGNSYYNRCTTGQTDTGKGEMKTTTELVKENTFRFWDFSNTWSINEGESYPYLQWSDHVPTPPPATGVTISSPELEFTYGDISSAKLNATVEPNCAVQMVTWSTSDSEVVRVDESGWVTPVGAGEAIITVTTIDEEFAEQVNVTVNKKVLTIDGSGSFTVENKEYDGTTSATITDNNLTLVGLVDGDAVTLNPIAEFANTNVAEGITVSLTSESSLNGVDADNYILSLTDAPTTTAEITASHNARLLTLTLSSETLSPIFSGEITQYTLSVDNETMAVTVAAAPEHDMASLRINGEEAVSEIAAENIALEVGSNIITIEVTAQDGTNTKTYTITITRAQASSSGSRSSSNNSGDSSSETEESGPVVNGDKADITTMVEMESKQEDDGSNSLQVSVSTEDIEVALDADKDIKEVVIQIDDQSVAEKIVTMPLEAYTKMAQRQASLVINTARATLNIPGLAINTSELAEQFGDDSENIEIHLRIREVSEEDNTELNTSLLNRALKPIGKVLQFSLEASSGNKTIPITSFGKQQVRGEITLSQEELANVENARNLNVYRFNSQAKQWEYVRTTLSNDGSKLYFYTNTFSDYTVMESKKAFIDTEGHWAQEDLNFLAGKEIIKGYENNIFRPENHITRAEFASILVNLLNIPADSPEASSFDDVASGAWYYPVVEAAVKTGIINGYGDGSFGPNDRITREQVAVLLVRALEVLGRDKDIRQADWDSLKDVYSDVDKVSQWAKEELNTAVQLGIINGVSDSTIAPDANASRAQAGIMIIRLMDMADLIVEKE